MTKTFTGTPEGALDRLDWRHVEFCVGDARQASHLYGDGVRDDLASRIGEIDEATDVLREQRILVDRDDHGYMLQTFTKPLGDRPALFFEIIQRKGGISFGKGNFRALVGAIEEEQAKRGTL